jgi:predicted NACHT family NTPase
LGDPGGGKSTFVNHLAHCLAMQALEPQSKWLDLLPGWPGTEAGMLPIVVILRDFTRGLSDRLPPRAEPSSLWDFIVERLKAQNLGFAADPIRNVLDKGQTLVLLDGLDEVPAVAQRAFVRDAVMAFIQRYPDNRFLITCRVLSYQNPDLRLPELPVFELAAFDEKKIDRFITAWYQELAGGVVRLQDADGMTRSLQQAVHRPDLWRLASNPLLLTVMALVHTHRGRPPDARALLYEETVDILLWRWEQVKVGGQDETLRLRQLLLEANRAEADLKRVLWQLAFEAHAKDKAGDDQDKLADIGELKLEKSLATLKGGDRNWAHQVIKTMKLRAGLLLERVPEVFTFPHRTFQEYLAGAHLAAQSDFAKQACDRLDKQGMLWREAVLLAAGRLVYSLSETARPLELISELCPGQAGDDEVSWHKAWLAMPCWRSGPTGRATARGDAICLRVCKGGWWIW